MTEDLITWLVGEVEDLLDASGVGLYEFLWLLRGRVPDLALDDSRAIAAAALRQILTKGTGKLVLLIWPGQDSVGDTDLQGLRVSDWDDPRTDMPYVALTRN